MVLSLAPFAGLLCSLRLRVCRPPPRLPLSRCLWSQPTLQAVPYLCRHVLSGLQTCVCVCVCACLYVFVYSNLSTCSAVCKTIQPLSTSPFPDASSRHFQMPTAITYIDSAGELVHPCNLLTSVCIVSKSCDLQGKHEINRRLIAFEEPMTEEGFIDSQHCIHGNNEVAY